MRLETLVAPMPLFRNISGSSSNKALRHVFLGSLMGPSRVAYGPHPVAFRTHSALQMTHARDW